MARSWSGTLWLAVLAFVSAALVASAAGATVKAPVVKPAGVMPFDWNGPYLGAVASYGLGDSEHYFGAITTGPFDVKGWALGGALGYNWQRGNWILGVEADLSSARMRGSLGPGNFGGYDCGAGPCETELRSYGTARLRAGPAFDRIFPYITGGVAVANYRARIANDAFLFSGGGNRGGWTAGAGVEYALSQNVTFKVEYLHAKFDSVRYGSPPPSNASLRLDLVRFGINLRR